MKFSLASAAGALLLAAGVKAGNTQPCGCQEVVVWETETVYVTVAPGYQTPSSCAVATAYPTDCTECGYTIVGPLPQYIATEICTTVTCNGKAIPTTYTTGSTCTVNTMCTVDKYGNTASLQPITKTVTACDFPQPTLLPAGCAYETCEVPEWIIYDNGVAQTVPACVVTFTYWPEPSYYPAPYEYTTTAWVNGAPVISVINNISINIITPTGSVYAGPTGTANPTNHPSSGPNPTGPGSVSPTGSSYPSASPSASPQAFVLAANDGTVGLINDNLIEFAASDSVEAQRFTGFLLAANGDLTDINGNVATVDNTLIQSDAGSDVSFASPLVKMLFRRQDNTTAPANATLVWDFTDANVLEAFYGTAEAYFYSCNSILKLVLSTTAPSGCSAVTLVRESLSNLQNPGSPTTGTTEPTTGPTTSPTETTATTSTTGTTATTPTTSPTSSTVPTGFADSMVYWHNQYRDLHGVPPVTWNDTLAAYAANYATQCSTQHSGSPDYGENLAYGGYTNPAYYIYLWYNEETSYNYSNPGFSTSTGHFTQVVWADTAQIGCGWVTSCAGTLGADYPNYLACEYAPYGNVDGEYAANVPPPVSNASPPVPAQELS